MSKNLKVIMYLISTVIVLTGCKSNLSNDIGNVKIEEKSNEIDNQDISNIPREPEDRQDAKKFKRVLEVKEDPELERTERVSLYGFDIPIYLIRTDYDYDTSKKDDIYPYVDWFEGWTMISIPLNVDYPEGGGETYKLKNFLELKYGEEIVNNIMERFKKGENFTVDFEDETYIKVSTATDDTRFIYIGYIEYKR